MPFFGLFFVSFFKLPSFLLVFPLGFYPFPLALARKPVWYTRAGLVLGRRVSLPICNHHFMAFTRGVNADQMENSPAGVLQLLVLPCTRSQSLILIIRPQGNSVCSPNALLLSRWSRVSSLQFPS